MPAKRADLAIQSANLDEFVGWCALTAVRTQELYDREHDQASYPTITPRMRISTLEVNADLFMQVDETTGFGIRVTPLNLGYRIMRSFHAEADARVTVVLEQTASPQAF